jgi:hypothetical protein
MRMVLIILLLFASYVEAAKPSKYLMHGYEIGDRTSKVSFRMLLEAFFDIHETSCKIQYDTCN